MALSIPDCQKGAIVCEVHDERGRPLAKKRYGTICKVVYANGTEEYTADGVKEVWVEFEEGKPERVSTATLVVFKSFDQAAYDRIMNRERNRVVAESGAGTQDATNVTVGRDASRKRN